MITPNSQLEYIIYSLIFQIKIKKGGILYGITLFRRWQYNNEIKHGR